MCGNTPPSSTPSHQPHPHQPATAVQSLVILPIGCNEVVAAVLRGEGGGALEVTNKSRIGNIRTSFLLKMARLGEREKPLARHLHDDSLNQSCF